MKSINLDILPENARKELWDFYDFLISKYVHKQSENKGLKNSRPYALAKGEFTVPDNFNEPLPDDYLKEFYK